MKRFIVAVLIAVFTSSCSAGFIESGKAEEVHISTLDGMEISNVQALNGKIRVECWDVESKEKYVYHIGLGYLQTMQSAKGTIYYYE